MQAIATPRARTAYFGIANPDGLICAAALLLSAALVPRAKESS
jgi:hypothetical protein